MKVFVMVATLGLMLTVGVLVTIYTEQAFAATHREHTNLFATDRGMTNPTERQIVGEHGQLV